MRISDSMNFDQVKRNLNKNRNEISDLQEQAATLKRVVKPSDDPVAANKVLSAKSEIQNMDQFKKNVAFAESFLNFTDTSLGDLAENLIRVKELILNQSNDASANETTRKVVATEVHQIYEHILQLANRKLGDRFIFGGYRTKTLPFDQKGRYQGDSGEILVPVDKTSFISINVPGSLVFLGKGVSLQGGIIKGSKQPMDLKELKEEQKKNVEDKDSKKLSRSLASLRMNHITDDINAPQSSLSHKNELSKNGINIFNLLNEIEISLQANDKLGLQESLEQVDKALHQVILARSQVGAQATSLGQKMLTLSKDRVDSFSEKSRLEDADMFELLSSLKQKEGTLKATLQTSSSIIEPSLMDFLR